MEKSEIRWHGRRRLAEPGASGASSLAGARAWMMAVNGDEGEPGTFKDRYFLETDPHRFLEGMLIAAWIIEAPDTYVYLRDEYPQCRAITSTPRWPRSKPRASLCKTPASTCGAVPAPMLRRGILAMLESIEGSPRAAAATSRRFPAQVRAVRPADPDQQHRDPVPGARHRRAGAGMVPPRKAATGARDGARFPVSRAESGTPGSSSPRPASPRAS